MAGTEESVQQNIKEHPYFPIAAQTVKPLIAALQSRLPRDAQAAIAAEIERVIIAAFESGKVQQSQTGSCFPEDD